VKFGRWLADIRPGQTSLASPRVREIRRFPRGLLDQAFAAARTFHPLSQQEVAALLARSKEAAADGEYELFKTSAHFDSTAHHPAWLGGQSSTVDKLTGPAE
jgi:hypothetical protein